MNYVIIICVVVIKIQLLRIDFVLQNGLHNIKIVKNYLLNQHGTKMNNREKYIVEKNGEIQRLNEKSRHTTCQHRHHKRHNCHHNK